MIMLDGWYSLVDFMLPFPWLAHAFMKNAFMAIILVMPLFGILGTMVVNNRMAFFSDSLGHGAFTGIALGTLLGFIKPLAAIILFSIVFAGVITYVKHRSTASNDTIIGVFSSFAIALGLIIMSHSGSFAKYSSYLIGDLLSISQEDILMILGVFLGVICLWFFIFNRLLIVSINSSLAASRGIQTLTSEMLFSAALAIVVAISIQWVGLLIINSMLVLPAAAARNISNNIRQYHLISVFIALLSGISGLVMSYYWNTATGATIVLIASGLFFLTFTLRHRFLS